jgi:hypothetical protein
MHHIFYSRLLKSPMADPQNAKISSRKRPKQARSTDLVAAILEAAAQVLAKEGAPRFTTARVAERAGVSVGSIYQYFPNKRRSGSASRATNGGNRPNCCAASSKT